MPRETNIQIRRGSSTEWNSANPTLSNGEIAIETNTKKLKVGDGSTAWNNLKYVCFDGGDIDAPTVPGAPTWNIAYNLNINGDNITNMEFFAPSDDGGSPITSYKVYADGVLQPAGEPFGPTGFTYTPAFPFGTVLQVSAVNAVGEGPKSVGFTLQDA